MYFDLLITSMSWKHQSALIYSHVGTYIFYYKINLYCFCDGWSGLYNPITPFSECFLCPSQQRTACSSVRNSTCDRSSSNTQKALPEKNISLKQKKEQSFSSLYQLLVKVIYNKVYVAIIIDKNHKHFLLYLGILTQNILLDIYTGKDTFQAIKQAYIVGCNRIKHVPISEEIMEEELNSRSEYNRNWPFLVWCTLIHDFAHMYIKY